MRSLFIFSILALLTLSFVSCAKEEIVTPSNKLVGIWKIKELLVVDNTTDVADTIRSAQPEGASFEFTPNGWWVEKVAEIDIDNPDVPGDFVVSSGFYKFDQKKIYLFQGIDSDTLDYKRTDTSLLLSQEVLSFKVIINCRKQF